MSDNHNHLSAQDILDISQLKMLIIANNLIREIESFAKENGDCSRCQANLAATLALDVIRAMALLTFSFVVKDEEKTEEIAGTLTTMMLTQIQTAAERVFLPKDEAEGLDSTHGSNVVASKLH
ncbi:MAG: hypothetical protein MN733_13805 [Nitrososphaera sp.]|nr:hypothetical protein [Nitrososphaera sp.]